MSVLTSLQMQRFEEIAHVPVTAGPVARWRINKDEEKYTSAGPARKTRVQMTITNLGDIAAVLAVQNSDADVSDNNPGALNFEASFVNTGATATVGPRSSRVLELDQDPTKKYLQLHGSGSTTIRIQGQCGAPIDRIVIPRPTD